MTDEERLALEKKIRQEKLAEFADYLDRTGIVPEQDKPYWLGLMQERMLTFADALFVFSQ